MEELKTAMDKYKKQFGDEFPTFCFMHLSFEEMVSIIEQCLDAEKDVYEMGHLDEGGQVMY